MKNEESWHTIKFEKKSVLIGFLYAFLGTMLFSFKSIFIKLAYEEGLDTDSVLMLRMGISLPIYLCLIAYLSRKNNMPKKIIKQNFPLIIFVGFMGYFLSSWLDLKGLEYISAGLERLTLFTYPIFIAILGALFFNTPIDKRIVVTLILTYLGLWTIFNQEAIFNTENTALGTFLVLSSAFTYSIYVLFSKKVIDRIGSVWFTSLAMSVSSVFILFYYVVFFDLSDLTINLDAWIYMALLSIVSTVIPSFMLSEALVKVGATRMGIIGTLGPVVTIIFAVWILDEPFTVYHAIGTILVILGVMLLTIKVRPLQNKKS
jgi:drug/metabolite transporter (DMT)-like permease